LKQQFKLSSADADAHLQFLPDSARVIAVEKNKAYCWDINTGELKDEWSHEDKFRIDPSGRYRIWREANGVDYIEDLSLEEPTPMPLPDLYSASFCPDGSRFVLDPQSHVEAGVHISPPEQIFDSATAKSILPPWRFALRGGLDQPFSHDGRYYLAKDETGIWLWDLDRRASLVEPFPPQRTVDVIDAQLSHDRRTLVILTEDRTLSCWDTTTGRQCSQPIVIPAPSSTDDQSDWMAITLNRSADTVAILGEYRDQVSSDKHRDVHLVQVWNLKTGRPVFDPLVFDRELESWVTAVRFISHDARLLIAEYIYHPYGGCRQRPPGPGTPRFPQPPGYSCGFTNGRRPSVGPRKRALGPRPYGSDGQCTHGSTDRRIHMETTVAADETQPR
jgi:WD40 repeat protein